MKSSSVFIVSYISSSPMLYCQIFYERGFPLNTQGIWIIFCLELYIITSFLRPVAHGLPAELVPFKVYLCGISLWAPKQLDKHLQSVHQTSNILRKLSFKEKHHATSSSVPISLSYDLVVCI